MLFLRKEWVYIYCEKIYIWAVLTNEFLLSIGFSRSLKVLDISLLRDPNLSMKYHFVATYKLFAYA
jgi:hypothetical protein